MPAPFVQNELAAQRVIRLLLAEPSMLFKENNTMAAVLMVVPQNGSNPSTPRRGSDDSLGQLQPRAADMQPAYSKSFSGNEKGMEFSACDARGCPSCPCTGSPAGSCCDTTAPAVVHAAGSGQDTGDRNVHMLIEMSGEGPGLDIRSFPRQIVQLISAEDGDSTSMNYYYPQEDYSPHDSIILNSSSGEVP